MIRIVAIALCACLFNLGALARGDNTTDWPNYLGPNYDQVSKEKGFLRSWPKEGPAISWRVPVAQGWNGPSVAASDVILSWSGPGGQSARAEGTTCFDAETGKERWTDTYDIPPYWKAGIGWGQGGVRATPCITDKYVFTLGASGHMRCLDRKTGKLVWSHEVYKDYTQSGEKGCCVSLVVAGNKLVHFLGDGMTELPRGDAPMKSAEDFSGRLAVCRAYNLDTGKLGWEWKVPHRETSRRGEGTTPIVRKFNGQDCVIFPAQTAFICLQSSDGTELWRLNCDQRDRGTDINPVIPLDNGFVGILGPGSNKYYYFQVAAEKPFDVKLLKKTMVKWSVINLVRHEDCLYGFVGSYNSNFPNSRDAKRGNMEFTCIDIPTGKVLWSEAGFNCSGSQIIADGLIFARSFQTLHLIEPSTKGFVEKGRLKIHDIEDGHASMSDFVMPVLSRGKLYVRTGSELLCLKVAP